MTKVQMVDAIQLAEAKAWKEYREAKDTWGIDNSITARFRTAWVVIFDLRESMGIDGLNIERLFELDLVA